MAGRFNIRVYGIWIEADRVLVNEETIKGNNYVKFPGGGLEFGEGTIECVKREWMEEMGLEIEVLEHFYTTDFYQPSAFDNSQVVSIYYMVKVLSDDNYIVNLHEDQRSYWLKLEGISADTFSLPIDKIVGDMLARRYAGK